MSSDTKGSFARPFTLCNDSHPEIAYQGKDCPVCAIRLELDQVLDAKEDIDEENIFELFDEIKDLKRKIKGLENYLGIKSKRHWFAARYQPVHVKDFSIKNDTPTSAELTLPEADF